MRELGRIAIAWALVAGTTPQAARAQASLFAPGVISTAENDDLTPTFAPDGSRLVFARRAEGGTFTLFESLPEAGGWGAPRRLPFSGPYDDQAPALAPDGSRLFFQSRRPADSARPPAADAPRDDDVWVVELGEDGWGEPRLVGPPISTAPPAGAEPFQGREMAPAVAADGTLWFWSQRPGDSQGASDLYVAPPAGDGWAEPVNAGPTLNSEHYETHPSIAADGSFLLFACDGCPDSRGASDLYVSRRIDGVWSAPVNLGPAVNSTTYDFGATLSPDGRRLLFSSNRSEGPEPGRQNIYVVDLAAVPALAFLDSGDDRIPGGGLGTRRPDVSIRHLANEGVLVHLPEGTVLIDGLFGDGLPEYPSVAPATRDSLERGVGEFGTIDLLLVTHVHRDHFDAHAVERHLLANPDAHLVASRQVADSLRILGSRFAEIGDRVHVVDATPGRTSEVEVAGVPVRPLGIAHPPSRNQPVEHLAYVVGAAAPIAHLGDLSLESAGIDALVTAGPVALALAPHWILTREGVKRIREALTPRCLAGFHIALGEEERARRQLEERAPGALFLARPATLALADCARAS